MSIDRIKCKNIISNVLYPVANENIVNKLQGTKFSIIIGKTLDICNEKWMTFSVRYVDPETLDTRLQLVKLININTRNSGAKK